jgi:hydrogenase maturation protease
VTTHSIPTTRLVVCGNPDRGDDGVALAAAATLLPTLPPAVSAAIDVRRGRELRLEDLVDLGPDERCVILDAVSGVAPGTIVVMPIDRLAETVPFAPRSSHQLPLGLTVGLAAMLGRGSLPGAFVGLAGAAWGLGEGLSAIARDSLPAYRAAIRAELMRPVGATAGSGPGG